MGLTRPRAHQLQDSDFKASCRVITIANITLSGGAPATVDGVSLSAQDRVLVTGQTSGAENGLYRVTTVGTGSNGTWVRSADADATGDITAGMTVMVTEGSTYADTSWKLTTNDPITVGTTSLTFEQASAYGFGTVTVDGTNLVADQVGDTLTITAGNNISLSGNTSTDTYSISVSDTPTFGTVITGNVIPSANITYDLGNTTNRFNDIYLSGNTINLGSITIKDDGGTMGVFGSDGTTPVALGNTASVTASGNIETTGGFFKGDGSLLSNLPDAGNAFVTIAVSGQSNIVADSSSDTLTLVAGTGIAITSNAVSDTLTFSTVSLEGAFAADADFGLTTDLVTTSEDLGDLASTNSTTYDLGTIISAEGLIYPGQLVLPQYTVGTLPSVAVTAQLIYVSDETGGATLAFSDGTNWRRVQDRNIVS